MLTLSSPSGKVVSGYPQFSDNDTKMTYRVQVSKDQSDLAQNAGVTISGLPNGTTYTVEETGLGSGDFTNWKYVKTDYTSTTSPAQNIASSETEIAAITNTKVTNLMITKSVDTASGDGNGVTFTYVVTLTTPTGITRDQLKTILGDGWTNVENSSTDVYNSFTITPVTNNAGSYSTSVPNIPYGTKYTVTESELSGWLNIAKSGDTGTISSTASTAIFTNAQKNDLTLTKTLATGTPNTETGKMFLYEVTLEAPTGMEFTKTSGTGTALKLYVKNSTNNLCYFTNTFFFVCHFLPPCV